MTKLEKFINAVFKIIGLAYGFLFMLYVFDVYQPMKWVHAFNIFLIGISCWFTGFTNITNKEVEK